MRFFPVRDLAWRVFLGATFIVAAVLGIVLLVATQSGRRAAREAERRGLEQAADFTAQLLAGRGRSLAGGARVFVQGPYFRSLVAERRRDDILDQAFEAAEQLDADWVFITDERGSLLAKSDEPGAQGTAMGGIPLVAGALEGRTVSGYGVSRDSLLFQAVAVPVVVPGAAPVGVLVATKIVDRQVARDVDASTGMDVVFYALDAQDAPRLSTTSFADVGPARAMLAGATVTPSGQAAAGTARELRIDRTRYVLQGASLTTAGGEIVGGFLVARSDRDAPAANPGIPMALLLAGAIGLLLAALAASFANRSIAAPARALAGATTRALEGNFAAAARDAGTSAREELPEEIARLGRALVTLMEELSQKQALVAAIGGTSRVRDPGVGDTMPDDESAPARTPPMRLGAPSPRARQGASVTRPLVGRWTARGQQTLAPGTVLADRYTIQEFAGAGTTGVVYRAMDRTLGEAVAVKMLRSDLPSGTPEAAEELKELLQSLRLVKHRNVVRVHDCSGRGAPFLTMELVQGPSLASVLGEHETLPESTVIALAKQITRALEAAHEQGVVHGDLKPANVLITLDGTAKVTDFGIAALARRPRGARGSLDDVVTPPHLAGAIVGTPEYMAPEQLLGERPSVVGDLYAAGMILHECLTGSTPFPRETPYVMLDREAGQSVPGPGGTFPSPKNLEALVAWMTAHDPARRPLSAAMVAEALARLG